MRSAAHGLRDRIRRPRRGGVLERAQLTTEVLLAYAPLMRLVRGNELPAMVEGARSCPRVIALDEDDHETAVRLGRVVHRVLRLLPTDNRCLVRSLVLVRLLARRSIAARVVIGVRAEGGFAAHAWVEHDRRPVLPVGGFERLVEL